MPTNKLTLADIQHLQPLQLTPANRQQEALKLAEKITIHAGNNILKKRDDMPSSSFLLEGSVELRHSFSDRHPLSADSDLARQPLEGLVNNGSSIRALSECVLVRFDTEQLDNLQSTAMQGDYGVIDLDDADSYLSESMIDDDFQEDWTLKLLESPLALRLKPEALRNLMSILERVDVEQDESIVQQGSRADYFYILISGEAVLETDQNGPFKGQTIDLQEGQHFGEEALIAETLRNSSIRMVSDGIVGRLTRDQFMSVFSASLMPTASPAVANDLLSQNQGDCIQLDTRFKQEITDNKRPNFLNVPISSLRSSLPKLNINTTYLVTAEGGKRSELATCILRQHGYVAFLQTNSDSQ